MLATQLHYALSFTGTEHGMDSQQKDRFDALIREGGIRLLIHGACIGADDEADEIAAYHGVPRLAYPSTKTDKRVPNAVLLARTGSHITFHKEVLDPLKRNPLIVLAGDRLVACPYEQEEIIRSGTWTTVRHARRLGREVLVIRRAI
jgi:hypothetical protein